ncbi:MAG: hypothetical protein RLZZ09_147 [Pseudomonadota bacterium]|jgi:integrase
MQSKITDIQIRHWLKAGRPIAKAQGEVAGLTFILSAKGTAAWVLRYRLGGVQKEVTIGRYPDFSITDAKTEATKLRQQIQKGFDVARDKRQSQLARAQDQSYKALALDYETKVLSSLAESTQEARRYHIHSWLIPKLGAIPAKDINPADIVALIESAGQRSYTATQQLFITANAIFDHGMGKSIVSSNPCRGIKLSAVLGKAPPKKDRIMLDEGELRTLLTRMADHLNERSVIIIKLLLLTAVRVNELLRAEWQHVDFDKAEWTIPDSHAKKGKGFVIPLPSSAVDLFRRLEVLACGSAYVLPSQRRSRSRNKTMDPNAILMALGRMRPSLPEVRRFSPHDLRSTARSHLAALGVPLIVAERCLNHSLGGIVQVYDLHDYLDERRKALTTWADFLNHCESGREWLPGNVVPIRAAV